MARTKNFRDAQSRPNVAVVLDDPSPRFIEVRGRAEAYADGGEEVGKRLGAPFRFSRAWVRIRPRRIVAVGVNGGQFEVSARDVAQEPHG